MKYFTYHLMLAFILLLIGFSVYGAFIGAERAREFFSSGLMIAYWLGLAGVAGFSGYVLGIKRKKLDICFIHLGLLLVICGSMAGSENGHKLCGKVFGKEKLADGTMYLYREDKTNEIFQASTQRTYKLPFEINLEDIIIDMYPSGLVTENEDGDLTEVFNEVCVSKISFDKDGSTVKYDYAKVNHPVYFGGYHFYQYEYDSKEHTYTALKAVSSSGLNVVWAGYAFLCVGGFWHFWFNRLRRD